MVKLAALALVLWCASLAQAADVGSPQYVQQLIEFHRAYDVFFRDLLGCPQHAQDPAECKPQLGTVNYPALDQLTKRAHIFQQPKKRKRKAK